MNSLSLSGIELLRAAVSGDAPLASISETIPMQPLGVELDYVKMSARCPRARPAGRHLNSHGGVHGGFAATVLDSVTGCAVHSILDAGGGYGTVDLHVKMLRSVPHDVDLIAQGRVIHLSRSLGVAEGTLKTLDDKIVAHASATCFIQRPQ